MGMYQVIVARKNLNAQLSLAALNEYFCDEISTQKVILRPSASITKSLAPHVESFAHRLRCSLVR